MSDTSERVDDRIRLRLSIKPNLSKRLDVAADVLDVDRQAVATMAVSLGLRILELTVINNVSATPSVASALEQTVDEGLSTALDDAG